MLLFPETWKRRDANLTVIEKDKLLGSRSRENRPKNWVMEKKTEFVEILALQKKKK